MRKFSGHTTPFAVLGHPIGHTLSPVMHNASIEALGMDAIYVAFDVAPEKLIDTLGTMADMGFGGVNLTIPHKEVAFNGIDDLDESARRLGSVNTVEFRTEGLRGHSTDGRGFVLAFEEAFQAGLNGRSVFVLGSGGAGRAVAITAAAEGAGRIVVTDLDEERPARVKDEIKELFPSVTVELVAPDPDAWRESCREADTVLQATPVGMKEDDESLLQPDAFRDGQLVFDLIYMYPETTFMKAAAGGGARTANGLGMLLHQGAYSFTIWTGKQAAVEVMRKALEQEVYR